jgi:hypothetical protein
MESRIKAFLDLNAGGSAVKRTARERRWGTTIVRVDVNVERVRVSLHSSLNHKQVIYMRPPFAPSEMAARMPSYSVPYLLLDASNSVSTNRNTPINLRDSHVVNQ